MARLFAWQDAARQASARQKEPQNTWHQMRRCQPTHPSVGRAMSDLTPIAVSVADAARMIGIGQTKMWELINAGIIDTRRCGRRVLVLADSLRAYVEALPEINCPQASSMGRRSSSRSLRA